MRSMLFGLSASLCGPLLLYPSIVAAANNATTGPGPGGFPPLPPGSPQPAPAYMVDNQFNAHGVAPDKGVLDGPVLEPLNASFEALLHPPISRRQSNGFWYGSISHNESISPYAQSGYTVFRNVKDFGAKGDGTTDDTAAINRAVASGSRCGAKCGSTSILYATVYFPPGTYLVSTPIIQYYFTNFIGDYNTRPTIKGSANFTGIALVDNDVYYPGGNGTEWYINQNQFYRSIRNMVFDLTAMNARNTDANGQQYVATGLHWQVAQATNLQNLDFKMPTSGDTQQTAVGIFMENGSGGFMSDITFEGGNIGFRAGSQQFTARGLTFTSCLTAISMIWDWGFTWQDITITSCYIALDCTNFGGPALSNGGSQGTGSIAIVDSTFNAVPYGITTNSGGPSPNIILDNLYVTNPYGTDASIVQVAGGAPFLTCPANGDVTVQSWGMGLRYTSLLDTPMNFTGNINPAPSKAPGLLNNGKYFTQSKPAYQSSSASDFIVITDHGVKNDGTGDQSAAINSVLSGAGSSIVFFPSGVYAVKGTVKVPPGTKIVGELWPQIMATGSYFQDEKNPRVMVQVGQAGDTGVVQISDMLFTVQGPTAGCILMEWNIHESTQGSAAMWDSHFRVGGTNGSNLGLSDCPAGNQKTSCMAASMLLHVTTKASGYFENVWAWVADHDLDSPLNGNDVDDMNGVPLASNVQVSVFGARGILIESQGPTWFYGTAAEHSVLYQYQLQNANNIYLGTMQTETPYFQPVPNALKPFTIGTFSSDPTFDTCVANTSCADAWALRIQNSSNVYVYSAGFYSFFNNFDTSCNPLADCQEKLIDTSYSQGLWIYNIFTRGSVEIVSPEGLPPVFQNNSNQLEYTSELSAWLPLAQQGKNIGGESGDGETVGTVSILPLPCTSVPPLSTFTMSSECTSGIIVLPTSGPNASVQNTPSGEPPVCNEVCDFYRLISGTCCGTNGTLGNPIAIPPSVTIPWDIPLPSGYTPNVNITIPIPGYYNPSSTSSSVIGGLYTTTRTTVYTTSGSTRTSTYTSTGTRTTGAVTFVTTGTTTITTSGSTRTSVYTSTGTSQGGGGGGGTTYPCGVIPVNVPHTVFGVGIPLPSAITLPAGFCDPHPTPHIIPPHPLIPDPPCFPPRICAPCQDGPCPPGIEPPSGSGGDEGDPECSNDPAPDAETGRCSNGNFPVWDVETGQIDCDIPDDQVPEAMSQCQMDADMNYNETEAAIECYLDECDGGTGGFRKRAPRVPKECTVPDTYMPGPPSGSNLVCDATFDCDTDRWPNVCNNARSAMVPQAQGGRGAPQALTQLGSGVHLTSRYYDLHGVVAALGRQEGGAWERRRALGEFTAVGGWGLVGCEVEEYPFGNSYATDPGPIAQFNDRPTLRLIPAEENGDHGRALGRFLQYANEYSGKAGNDLVYCVAITGNNQPSDYCINSGSSCNNKCAGAYGPAFILVNDVTLADQQAAQNAGLMNEQRWDRWFDQAAGRKYDHTISFTTLGNGTVNAVVTTMPPQFAPTTNRAGPNDPNSWPIVAPGQKIYTGVYPNGAWMNQYTIPQGQPNAGQVRAVGTPRNAPRQPPNDGTNYRWDAPPQPPMFPGSVFPSKRDEESTVEPIDGELVDTEPSHPEELEDTNPAHWVPPSNASMSPNERFKGAPKELSRRQALGGSWLDPAVYIDVLQCSYGDDMSDFGNNVYGTYPPGAGTQTTVASTSAGGGGGSGGTTTSTGTVRTTTGTGKTTTTSPTKPTTTTTPTITSAPSARAFVFYNYRENTVINGVPYEYYDVQGYDFAAATANPVDGGVCDGNAVAHSAYPGNKPQSYPTKLPISTLSGLSGCAYTGASTAVGSVTCSKGKTTGFPCTNYPSATQSADVMCTGGGLPIAGADFHPVAHCNYP